PIYRRSQEHHGSLQKTQRTGSAEVEGLRFRFRTTTFNDYGFPLFPGIVDRAAYADGARDRVGHRQHRFHQHFGRQAASAAEVARAHLGISAGNGHAHSAAALPDLDHAAYAALDHDRAAGSLRPRSDPADRRPLSAVEEHHRNS